MTKGGGEGGLFFLNFFLIIRTDLIGIFFIKLHSLICLSKSSSNEVKLTQKQKVQKGNG